MDEDVASRVYADPLARWFVTEAYKIADTGQLVAAAGEQLVNAGIPLFRLAYFQLTLHPELDGKAYFWRRGQKVQVQTAAAGLKDRPDFRDNPIAIVYEKRKTLRVRLEDVEPTAPVLRQFKAEGATDYVALPLLFGNGHVDGLSVISDKAGGFSMADLDRMFLLQFAFTRIVESHSLRDTAANLLDAYVGRAAGQRILAGEIKRGSGQTIEAVLWYCDLRGFTRASDTLPRDTVINLLNDYFDVMGKIVTGAGGEILKFMGDGMLGMFPVPAPGERARVALNVVRAAGSVADAMTILNGIRAAADEPAVRFGLALHIGEVMFGNIGASNRLDFTVIGPAVNHAARLEKLCVPLGRPIVLSGALAELLPSRDVESLGIHSLKDIDQPQPVFGLRGAGGWSLP
ncbi:adenylate/guanylate cyclase domain-containing protein [Reyranella sp.]|jgi:adenylate cyclase|uniref:adenylate/guanylate cyclase domain-containing protein n=1 Tax=Reyranella sp. TaxID=1929291 RepID=UPI002F955A08